MNAYDIWLSRILRFISARNRVPASPTREQMIDWAWGSAVIENNAITREMVVRAVDERTT